MGLKISWDMFSRKPKKTEEELDREKQLNDLDWQKKLQAKKLEASEVDDDVIEFQKKLNMILRVAEVTDDVEQQNKLLRTLGKGTAIEGLAKDLNADHQREMLMKMDDKDFKKFEKAFVMWQQSQGQGNLLGFEEEEKIGFKSKNKKHKS